MKNTIKYLSKLDNQLRVAITTIIILVYLYVELEFGVIKIIILLLYFGNIVWIGYLLNKVRELGKQ